MAVVLAALGAFLYLRFQHDLDASFNRSLRTRAGDVAALVRRSDPGGATRARGTLAYEGESFAQVLEPDGTVIDGTPGLAGRSALGPAVLARARAKARYIDGSGAIDSDERTRILATPIRARGRGLVVVVGASLEDDDEALHSLLVQLLLGAPVALLLASLAGYGVAAAALRPVEAMRVRASEIGDAAPGRRLPMPPAEDEIFRLGETLNDMLGRLESALEREQTFVGDASHELRTPLAILKTELELALRAGRTEDELRAAITSAAEETDRLTQLAEDLLVIARADRGRLPVHRAAIDAGELLEEVRTRFGRRAGEQDRGLRVAAPPGLVLDGDRLRIEQALGNIVDNALRHGGGTVTVSASEGDDAVRLRVSDEGEGFPEGFLDQAFDRFTRDDSARGRGGAGLGLAIVEAIAGAHGGRAGAENLREGAEVWIELPADAEADA